MSNTKFKTGISGNPKGRPKMTDTEHVNQIRKLSPAYVRNIFSMFAMMPLNQLNEYLAGDITVFEKIMGKLFLRASDTGDHRILDFILHRTIGKVENQEVSIPPPTIIKLIGEDAVVAIGVYERHLSDD